MSIAEMASEDEQASIVGVKLRQESNRSLMASLRRTLPHKQTIANSIPSKMQIFKKFTSIYRFCSHRSTYINHYHEVPLEFLYVWQCKRRVVAQRLLFTIFGRC